MKHFLKICYPFRHSTIAFHPSQGHTRVLTPSKHRVLEYTAPVLTTDIVTNPFRSCRHYRLSSVARIPASLVSGIHDVFNELGRSPLISCGIVAVSPKLSFLGAMEPCYSISSSRGVSTHEPESVSQSDCLYVNKKKLHPPDTGPGKAYFRTFCLCILTSLTLCESTASAFFTRYQHENFYILQGSILANHALSQTASPAWPTPICKCQNSVP